MVQANTADTDTIDMLLEILDQKEGPVEVLAESKPRPIPLFNTVADEVAEIVREVYQDRISTSSRGRQMSPQDMFAAMRGRSSRGATDNAQKMSIGVDGRTNSLIVSAPEALFEQVRQFVEGLDEAAAGVSRDELLERMTYHNIGVGVHYLAIGEHPYYAERYGMRPEDTPIATAIGRRTLSLPLSAALADDDVDDVVAALTLSVS